MIDNSNRKDITIIILIFVLTILLSIFSYFFLISDYKKIEISQNNKEIKNLLTRLDNKINTINDIAKDYAFWDDTYLFAKNQNNNFLYENFREGTNTLNDLSLDFIIIKKKNRDLIYSKYSEKLNFINNLSFEAVINKRFSNKNIFSAIFEYHNRLFYIVKQNILPSDGKGKLSGYLYMGKYLSNTELSKYQAKVLKLQHKNIKKENSDILVFQSDFFNKINVTKKFTEDVIYNYLHFYDNKKLYLFSLEQTNKIHMLKEGKKTIFIYNCIIFIFCFIIFFIGYKYRKTQQQSNIILEKLVSKRTKKIIATMGKLKNVNEKLYNLAHTDDLTKIHNRRNYFLLSHKAFEKSFLNKKYISLIMIDLDSFKQINDTYGHDIGDKILIKFVNTIKPFINEDEIFGRLGGEEFAITLPNSDIEGANLKAEVLRSCIEKMSLDVNQKNIKITASFGVSDNNSAHSIDEMLLKADKLLYSAKKSGKNLVRSRLTLF